MLIVGIRKQIAPVRYASLGLLGLTVVKLFFHDLSQLDQLSYQRIRSGRYHRDGRVIPVSEIPRRRRESQRNQGHAYIGSVTLASSPHQRRHFPRSCCQCRLTSGGRHFWQIGSVIIS
jgi:Predicted membrane protein (DUF2339)